MRFKPTFDDSQEVNFTAIWNSCYDNCCDKLSKPFTFVPKPLTPEEVEAFKKWAKKLELVDPYYGDTAEVWVNGKGEFLITRLDVKK